MFVTTSGTRSDGNFVDSSSRSFVVGVLLFLEVDLRAEESNMTIRNVVGLSSNDTNVVIHVANVPFYPANALDLERVSDALYLLRSAWSNWFNEVVCEGS